MRNLVLVWAVAVLCPYRVSAQNLSGIINHYAAVSAIDTCSGRLTVNDTTGFRKGASVLLIQMQGAEIADDNNLFFGTVLAMNFCGRHEIAVVDSVGFQAIYVQKRLQYAYSLAGKLQVVSIPSYANATVTDTLRPGPWNGTTGGVLALQVSGTLTLQAPLLADGCGFRGGIPVVPANNNCTWLIGEAAYYYGVGSWRGMAKGEGIAIAEPDRSCGRGAQANGGGGGNDHNSGGGGGAQITDGGGGGDNDEPGFFGCDGYFPGIGGRGVASTTGRLFLGGGGGAGHTNNTTTGPGGAGGGIIILQAGTIAGASPLLSANGADGGTAEGDGGGGGGAGGSIWLTTSANANLQVRATGGKGGGTSNLNSDRCFGPGGGGSGGRILTNLNGIPNPAGGSAGLITASTLSCNGTNGGAQIGENGTVQPISTLPQGVFEYNLPEVLVQVKNDTICPDEVALFQLTANPGDWTYQWQQQNTGVWQNLADGQGVTGATNDSLTLSGAAALDGIRLRCLVSRPGCYETLSGEAVLHIVPTLTANFDIALNSSTASFTNQSTNAQGYLWDFGDPASGAANSSTQPNAQHTFSSQDTFAVTLYAYGPCDTVIVQRQVIVLLPPTADFSVPATVNGCGSVSISPTSLASDNSTAFQWAFPGGTPNASALESPQVIYTSSGIYPITLTVTNAAGTSTKTRNVQVTVIQAPTAVFTTTINGNTLQCTNNSQNATNYAWNFGDGGTSAAFSPTHTYASDGTYTVILTTWNSCDTVVFSQTITILLPPVAGFLLPDTLIGCGSATVMPADQSSGTVTAYQWSSPGGTPSSSDVPNPSITYVNSGTYTVFQTVTNAVGSDQFEQTVVVQIESVPIVQYTYTLLSPLNVQFAADLLPGAAYAWDFGDGSAVSTVPNPQHLFAQSGIYVVTLIVSNSCGASVYQTTVMVSSNTSSATAEVAFRVYPNPSSGKFWVNGIFGSSRQSLQVFDASGQTVWEGQADDATADMAIDLQDLPAGIYYLAIRGLRLLPIVIAR
jgi:PKD repeat protein